MAREVWITGCGLISSLGEGRQAHWESLSDPTIWQSRADSKILPPHTVQHMVPLNLDRFIQRKGDQRQMGPLMHYGCHAAGLALAEAGIAGNAPLLARTHLIVASPSGERDIAVDEQVLTAYIQNPNSDAWLNEKLSTNLRPTLFLSQLPNLFAGNISIVLGVAGSSRTFMGEESAGLDAARIAYERVAANQGDVFLVGAAFHAVRPEVLMIFEAYGLLHGTTVPPLWQRPVEGVVLGSVGAFLVLEAREHAEARGARGLARLGSVLAGHADRSPGSAARVADHQWKKILANSGGPISATLSGACGGGTITHEEHDFLAAHANAGPVRGTAAALGHSMEASFFANIGLAITCLEQGRLFPALAPGEPIEARPSGAMERLAVTSWGHFQGEGTALIERIA